MPAAVLAVAAFAAVGLGSKLALTILINVALGALAKSITKKPKTQAPPINVTIKNTIENRRLIFGRAVRAGGVFVFYGTSSTSPSTSTKDLLWYVVVYTGHQVNAITDVWLDTERIPSADINPSTGAVSTAKFSGKLSIWKYLGTSAQTAHSDLDTAFTEWTSNHRLLGCSYIVVKMTRSDEAYPSGAPRDVTALVDGALLYDPRLDSTNGGSGSHRASNPSTWAPSENPALAVRWYLTGGSVHNDLTSRLIMYGLREAESRIDDAYFRAAANICDESISGSEAPPSGAQVRYACNLEVSTGEDRREILTAMLASMAGTLTYVHGKWRVYAGAYDAPLHSFTQDDLYGDLEVEDTTSHPERYNQVAAVYIDRSSQYQEATTIFRTDSAYETQDGGEAIPREIELRGVTDQYQAQRLAEIELRKSRMMRVVKLRGSLNLLKVAANETLTLSHERYSWTNRVFRCIAREFEFGEEAGRVVITARREDAGVYADMLTADYATGVSATDQFSNDAPDAPTNLTAEGFQDNILFIWTMPTFRGSALTVELWEHTAATPFSSATKVAETTGSLVLHRRTTMGPRYYWIRFRNRQGQVSDTYPATSGTPASPSSLSQWVISNGMSARDGAFRKTGATSAWDESVYSRDGFASCHLAFKASQTDLDLMVGLNTDPTTNHSYTSIDAAWFAAGDGLAYIYESGSQIGGNYGAYTTSTEFAFTSDGSNIRYYKDRVLIRTVAYSSTAHMDSSFSEPGAAINSLVFGPGSALELIDTAQLGNNAVTDNTVTVEPTDGNQAYAATTQPAIEVTGLSGQGSYTAPAHQATQVAVGWSGHAQISNLTSGVAVGESRIAARVFINSVEVFAQYMILEGYTTAVDWANFAGGRAFAVPAGQTIDVYLQTFRSFSTSGSSPAQTHYWREALLNLVPLKK